MVTRKRKKVFVLDTNVVLYDYNCAYNFHEHDVVIPITVLEELDNFKKGNDTLNYHAREFIRILDSLAGDAMLGDGVPLGKKQGKLRVIANGVHNEKVDRVFSTPSPDHRILSIAYNLYLTEKDRDVVLVTKDIALRMKAKSIGMPAEDYLTGKIHDVAALYTGRALIENVNPETFSRFYTPPFAVPVGDLMTKPPMHNQYFILRNGLKSLLAFHDAEHGVITRVDKQPAYGIQPRNSEQVFALHALCNPAISLVTLAGKAGTGKTLLALAAALEQRQSYRQIFLARPIIPLSNREMGFLPGDVDAKLDPFMQPLYDNLRVIQNQFPDGSKEFKKVDELLETRKLLVAPLAFIRGRTLDRIFFIVDEAQNLTPHEIKTIITRAGEGTKVIFTGDPYQIDSPWLDSESCGLSYLIDRMKGQPIYAHVTLEKGERSSLAELAANLL